MPLVQGLLFALEDYALPAARRVRRAARKFIGQAAALVQKIFDWVTPAPRRKRRYFAAYPLCVRCRARRVQAEGQVKCKECLRVKGPYAAEADRHNAERLARIERMARNAEKGVPVCV